MVFIKAVILLTCAACVRCSASNHLEAEMPRSLRGNTNAAWKPNPPLKSTPTPALIPTPSPTWTPVPSPTPSATPKPTPTPTSSQVSLFDTQMLDAVNLERSAHGLPPFCANLKLREAAKAHSLDMATLNYFSHTESNNSTPAQRVLAQGFQYAFMAENIAAGQTTIASVVNSWMNSAGHRANVLGNYKFFGVGYTYNSSSSFGHYWTQTFGTAFSSGIALARLVAGRSDFRSDSRLESRSPTAAKNTMVSSPQETKREARRSAASMCAGSTVWIVLCAVGAVLTAFAWLACFPIVFESSTLANAYDFHPIPQTTTQNVFKVVSTQFAFWTIILCVVGGYIACLKPHKNRARDLSRVRTVLLGIVCVFIMTFFVTLGTSHGYTRSIEAREPEFATEFNDFYCETRTLDVCLKGDRLKDLFALVGDGTTAGSASSAASPSVPLASWLRCRNVMVENNAKVASRQRAFLVNINITASADSWCGANFQNAKAAAPSPTANISVDTPYEMNRAIFSRFKREWPTRLLYDGLLLGIVLLFATAHCWCLTTFLRADGFEELMQDAKFAQSGAGMTPVITV